MSEKYCTLCACANSKRAMVAAIDRYVCEDCVRIANGVFARQQSVDYLRFIEKESRAA